MTRKIESLAEKYNLETKLGSDIGDALADRWLGNGHRERGYRKVADWFNRQIIKSACRDARLPVGENEIISFYETLRERDREGKSVSLPKLSNNEIDVQELVDDFVGYTTVYHYLTEEVEAEKERVPENPSEWSSATVEYRIEAFERDLKKALIWLNQLDLEGDVDIDIVPQVSDGSGTAQLSRVLKQGEIPPQEEDSGGTKLSERANNMLPDLDLWD